MNVNLTLPELQWLSLLLAMKVNQVGDNSAIIAKIDQAIDQHDIELEPEPVVLRSRPPGWHPGAQGVVTHVDLPGHEFDSRFYRKPELINWLDRNDLSYEGTMLNGNPHPWVT